MTYVLDILVASAIVVLVASGLVLVYGWARLINMAHGELVMVGAYVSASVHTFGLPFWFAAIVAAGTVGLILAAGHLGVFRRLPQDGLTSLLATWGLGLVLSESVRLAYGPGGRFVDPPVSGLVGLAGGAIPSYQAIVIAVAGGLVVCYLAVIRWSVAGLRIRAVVERPNAAALLGIDTERARLRLVFAGGALAGFAGALIAPMAPVNPYLGPAYSSTAFIVVLMSGTRVSALPIVASLFLGAMRTLTQTFLQPSTAAIVTLGVSIVAILAAQSRLSRW